SSSRASSSRGSLGRSDSGSVSSFFLAKTRTRERSSNGLPNCTSFRPPQPLRRRRARPRWKKRVKGAGSVSEQAVLRQEVGEDGVELGGLVHHLEVAGPLHHAVLQRRRRMRVIGVVLVGPVGVIVVNADDR